MERKGPGRAARRGCRRTPRLTRSPSRSRCARKTAASLTGTSSFRYKIWKTRLCTVLSWAQAECRPLSSAKQEPEGARDLQDHPGLRPLRYLPSSRKVTAPDCVPCPERKTAEEGDPVTGRLFAELGWHLRSRLNPLQASRSRPNRSSRCRPR